MELLGEEKNDGSILYGALEKASGGILLIDEVTDIPLSIQSKILRILIDGNFLEFTFSKNKKTYKI